MDLLRIAVRVAASNRDSDEAYVEWVDYRVTGMSDWSWKASAIAYWQLREIDPDYFDFPDNVEEDDALTQTGSGLEYEVANQHKPYYYTVVFKPVKEDFDSGLLEFVLDITKTPNEGGASSTVQKSLEVKASPKAIAMGQDTIATDKKNKLLEEELNRFLAQNAGQKISGSKAPSGTVLGDMCAEDDVLEVKDEGQQYEVIVIRADGHIRDVFTFPKP